MRGRKITEGWRFSKTLRLAFAKGSPRRIQRAYLQLPKSHRLWKSTRVV